MGAVAVAIRQSVSTKSTLIAAMRLFVDISATGTLLALTDDDSENVNYGFNFEFFGETYTDLFVGSNGFITFTAGSTDFSNEDLSNGSDTLDDLPAAAVFWDDWNPADTDSDGVYWQVDGSAGSQTLTVQWNNLVRFLGGPGEEVTFQAVIHEDSTMIEYRYLDVIDSGTGDNGASATVGIYDGSADGDFVHVSFNEAVIESGHSYCFEFVTPIPEPTSFGFLALGLAGLAIRRKR